MKKILSLKRLVLTIGLVLTIPTMLVNASEDIVLETEWNSQGVIEYKNSEGNIIFDASDFSKIANIVAAGKLQIAKTINGNSGEIQSFYEINNSLKTNLSLLNSKTGQSAVTLQDAVSNMKSLQASPNKTLVSGETYTINEGYYKGGSITAPALAAVTVGTAYDLDILSGKVAWVNGAKVTGTMPKRTSANVNLNAGGSATVYAGYYPSNWTVTANSLSSQTSGTASNSDILSGKKAWVNGELKTGTIASKAAATYTPGTTNQTIPSGQYLSGAQTIIGDSDLIATNIKSGVNIFNVTGTLTVEAHTAFSTPTVSTAVSSPTITLKPGEGISIPANQYHTSGFTVAALEKDKTAVDNLGSSYIVKGRTVGTFAGTPSGGNVTSSEYTVPMSGYYYFTLSSSYNSSSSCLDDGKKITITRAIQKYSNGSWSNISGCSKTDTGDIWEHKVNFNKIWLEKGTLIRARVTGFDCDQCNNGHSGYFGGDIYNSSIPIF